MTATPQSAAVPGLLWPTGPLTYPQLRTAADEHDTTTADSLTWATQAYQHRAGVDLTAASFTLNPAWPLDALKRSGYQPLYENLSAVGQYQLDGGRSQDVADEMMEWFADIIDAANRPGALFPAIAAVYDDGTVHLLDGCHRTAARAIAGQTAVPAYYTRIHQPAPTLT